MAIAVERVNLLGSWGAFVVVVFLMKHCSNVYCKSSVLYAGLLWAINPRQTGRQWHNYFISHWPWRHGNAYSNTDGHGNAYSNGSCSAFSNSQFKRATCIYRPRSVWWLLYSTTTTCSTRTVVHGVSITNEDLECLCTRPAGCVNGPRPALAPKFTNRFHFDQSFQSSVPPFAVIPHLAIRTYSTLEICLTSLRETGASQLYHQHHVCLTSCTTAAASTTYKRWPCSICGSLKCTTSKTANVDISLLTFRRYLLHCLEYDMIAPSNDIATGYNNMYRLFCFFKRFLYGLIRHLFFMGACTYMRNLVGIATVAAYVKGFHIIDGIWLLFVCTFSTIVMLTLIVYTSPHNRSKSYVSAIKAHVRLAMGEQTAYYKPTWFGTALETITHGLIKINVLYVLTIQVTWGSCLADIGKGTEAKLSEVTVGVCITCIPFLLLQLSTWELLPLTVQLALSVRCWESHYKLAAPWVVSLPWKWVWRPDRFCRDFIYRRAGIFAEVEVAVAVCTCIA